MKKPRWTKDEKRLAKMVMRLAKREGKAHRLLAEYFRETDVDTSEHHNKDWSIWYEDWLSRVDTFLKDGMVDDDVLPRRSL